MEMMYQVEFSKRNIPNFHLIKTICYPFNFNDAKNIVKVMSKKLISGIFIDDILINKYDSEQFTENSKVTLKSHDGRQITVNPNEINWDLGINLVSYFDSSNFMICFKFKSCLKYNYLKIDKNISENFTDLFKKMIKSQIIKEAMTKDNEAKQFNYPYDNDDIITECLDSIKFVPFPFTGLYRFTDKKSFNIYIYSNFPEKSIKNIFTEYDNILKTCAHEFKHITRVYYHLFNHSITLNTPKTTLKKGALIKEYSNLMKNRITDISSIYKQRKISYNEYTELDYGDIFELFFIGDKATKFFLANSIFCLKESSWNSNPNNFLKEYLKSINKDIIYIQKRIRNPLISSVLEYFKFESGKSFVNEVTYKDTSKLNKNENNSGIYDNVFTDKETISHCKFTK